MDDIIESAHSVVLAKNTRSYSDQSEPNVQCYTCGFEAKRSLMKEHMTVNHKGNLNPCFCIHNVKIIYKSLCPSKSSSKKQNVIATIFMVEITDRYCLTHIYIFFVKDLIWLYCY